MTSAAGTFGASAAEVFSGAGSSLGRAVEESDHGDPARGAHSGASSSASCALSAPARSGCRRHASPAASRRCAGGREDRSDEGGTRSWRLPGNPPVASTEDRPGLRSKSAPWPSDRSRCESAQHGLRLRRGVGRFPALVRGLEGWGGLGRAQCVLWACRLGLQTQNVPGPSCLGLSGSYRRHPTQWSRTTSLSDDWSRSPSSLLRKDSGLEDAPGRRW